MLRPLAEMGEDRLGERGRSAGKAASLPVQLLPWPTGPPFLTLACSAGAQDQAPDWRLMDCPLHGPFLFPVLFLFGGVRLNANLPVHSHPGNSFGAPAASR